MSHTVSISVQFKTENIKQLRKAFKALGWNVEENTTSRQYSGRIEGPYPYVAKNPGNDSMDYDIGINVKGDNLELLSDFYGGSLERRLGAGLGRLKQEYAVAVVEDEYPNSTVDRTTDEQGNVFLTVEEWG